MRFNGKIYFDSIIIHRTGLLRIYYHSFLFQIQAVGTGWISLALTFRGNLMGSDVVIGWVSQSGAATIIVS